METCWDCEIEKRSDQFVQMYRVAESRDDALAIQRIKEQHGEFLTGAYLVNAYDRQDGYKIHLDNYLESGDLNEIDKMVSHQLPEDTPKIKIIPLKPKAHHRRGFKPVDLYMITVAVVWIIAILLVHWAW